MKNLKKIMVLVVAVGVIGSATAVFAASAADIVSGLTGKTTDELIQERAAGKTYGTIAKEADKLEEFQAQMLEQKKAVLDQRVKDGTLTQQRADEIYDAIKNNQTSCEGSGSAAIGKEYGACFGQGSGMGNGNGIGRGKGNGSRNGLGQGKMAGRGNGLCNGYGAVTE